MDIFLKAFEATAGIGLGAAVVGLGFYFAGLAVIGVIELLK